MKTHSIKSRFLHYNQKIFSLQASVCTFKPRKLTGWGSEGVMGMVSVQVELNNGVVSIPAGLLSGVCLHCLLVKLSARNINQTE